MGKDGSLTQLGRLYAMLSFAGDTAKTDFPPVALLPSSKSLNLPEGGAAASIQLSGETYDRNGDPVTIGWSQVAGPVPAVFSGTAVANPTVSGLAAGTYVFQMAAHAAGKTDSARITVVVNPPNIAKNKPVSASSAQNDNSAAKANDGDRGTRWSSLDSDPQWIAIDLEKSYSLTGAKISWEAAYAKEYSIDVSANGSDWTPVFSTANGVGGEVEYVFNKAGRYIRMYSVLRNTRQQYWGNSLYEFEVYGTPAASMSGFIPDENRIRGIFVNSSGRQISVAVPGARTGGHCVVSDCLGKTVFSRYSGSVKSGMVIDAKRFKAGVYFVAVNDSRHRYRKSIVLLR
jgi:hypothetical protein